MRQFEPGLKKRCRVRERNTIYVDEKVADILE